MHQLSLVKDVWALFATGKKAITDNCLLVFGALQDKILDRKTEPPAHLSTLLTFVGHQDAPEQLSRCNGLVLDDDGMFINGVSK